jgi:hypothetical protein
LRPPVKRTISTPPLEEETLEAEVAVIPTEPAQLETTPLVAECTKEKIVPIYDPDVELKIISKRLLRVQKYALCISLISINTVLIFMSWYLSV